MQFCRQMKQRRIVLFLHCSSFNLTAFSSHIGGGNPYESRTPNCQHYATHWSCAPNREMWPENVTRESVNPMLEGTATDYGYKHVLTQPGEEASVVKRWKEKIKERNQEKHGIACKVWLVNGQKESLQNRNKKVPPKRCRISKELTHTAQDETGAEQ